MKNNSYTGFHPPSPSWTPDRLDPNTITPSQFYQSYINTRTPCIFTSHPTDPTWNATSWSLEQLEQRAGHLKVKIEQKTPQGNFGAGEERQTWSLERFLKRLTSEGGDQLYLTTQYKEETEEEEEKEEEEKEGGGGGGRRGDKVKSFEDYCQPPLSELTEDFPFRPTLLGKLVPQQVNLWLGSVPSTTAQDGTSSGLHHDFHDNLYILLRGRKRFTLFSPRDAGRMYTHGKISTVHPNGLINYQEDDDGTTCTRADGAYPRDVVRWRLHLAERHLAELEAKGQDTTVAESELEKITEEMLDFEVDGFEEHRDEFGFDDYDDDEDVFTESEEEEEKTRRKKRTVNNKRGKERNETDQKKSNKRTKIEPEMTKSHPPSFSKIPVSVLHRSSSGSRSPFPLLSKATKVTCHLGPGEMLYLPASWFHEVTSYADASATDSVHMAFNYWMAPPTTDDESQPYEDEYWEDQWKGIEEEFERRKGRKEMT